MGRRPIIFGTKAPPFWDEPCFFGTELVGFGTQLISHWNSLFKRDHIFGRNVELVARKRSVLGRMLFWGGRRVVVGVVRPKSGNGDNSSKEPSVPKNITVRPKISQRPSQEIKRSSQK